MRPRNFFKGLLIWLLLALPIFSISAQVGKEFWFVAPEVSVSHGDAPIGLRITALANEAKVTISMPANSGFTPISLTVPANTQVTVRSDLAAYSANFNLNNVENRPFNTVNNKGLLVSSDQDVSVYYEVLKSNNPDIFSLKGENGLGYEFYVVSQNVFPNRPYTTAGQTQPYEHVDIVAKEDNTVVTITPTIAIQGGAANTPITITLNKGQSYGIVAASISAGESLAGTHITSNKPIAVTTSDDSIEQFTSSGAWDLIGDQLVPVSLIGTEYVAIKTSTEDQAVNTIFVMATEADTWVQIDNNPLVALTVGVPKSFDITSTATSMYIKSTKPVYVYQVSGLWNNNGNEMGSALLPTINCTGSRRVSITRNFDKTFWVQLLTQQKNIASFKMYNDAGTAVNYLDNLIWKKVDPTDKGVAADVWYTATIDMSVKKINLSTGKAYYIENTKGLFHLSVLDENSGSMSYGYFSSFSNVKIGGLAKACVGKDVELSVVQPQASGVTYTWKAQSTGNTIIGTGIKYTANKSDRYFLESNTNGCIASDYIDVEIVIPSIVFTQKVYTLCPGDNANVSIVPNSKYSYDWSTGATGSSSISVPSVPGTTQTIKVKVTDDLGCVNNDSAKVVTFNDVNIDLSIGSKPLVDLTGNIDVCLGDTIFNRTGLGNYQWYLNGVLLSKWDGLNYMVPAVGGTYSLKASSTDGCNASKDLKIIVSALPPVDIVDKIVCPNTIAAFAPVDITPAASGAYSYLWRDQSGRTDVALFDKYNFDAVKNGLVSLTVTNKTTGCSSQDSASLSWYPQTTTEISVFSKIVGSDIQPKEFETCANEPVLLSTTSGFPNYLWSVLPTNNSNTTTASVGGGQTTNVVLRVTDVNNCYAYDTLLLKGLPIPVVDLSPIPSSICLGDKIEVPDVHDRYQWEIDGVVQTQLDDMSSWPSFSVGTFDVKLTVWNVLGCSASALRTITVKPLPQFILRDTTICANTSASFTGPSAMVSYLWHTGAVSNTLSTTATGQVKLTVTGPNGCSFKDSAMVSWFDEPSVKLSYFSSKLNSNLQSDEITDCAGSNFTIKATHGFPNYQWSHDATINDSIISVNLPPAGQTTISLLIRDANGCQTGDNITLKSLPLPVIDTDLIPDSVCIGDDLTVPDNWITYQWQIDNNPIDPLNNKPSIKTTQVGTFVYKITATNDLGCSATFNKTVTVNDLPAFSLSDITVCPNIPITFTGPANMKSYLWSDNSSSSSLIVNAEGDVKLKVTDNNGCIFEDVATVSWFAAPVVDIKYFSTVINADISPNEIFTCPENSVTLTATAGFSNYSWSHNASETTNVTSATVAIGGQTAVNLVVTDGNGCKTTDALVVKSNAVPVFDMNSIPDSVCVGDVLSIPDVFESYQWQVGSNPIDPLNNKSSFKTTQPGKSTFKVTVTNELGCATTHQKDVDVKDLPTFSLSDIMVCPNIPITFTGPANMKSYLWSDNSPSSSLIVNAEGDVKLKVTDNNGCIFEDVATVSWFAAPVVDIKYFSTVINADISPDEIFTCPENSVTLTATAGFSNYSWSHNASETTNVTSATVAIGGQTAVNLEVTDGNGCKTTDALVVKANAVPVFDMNSIPAEVCLGDVLTTLDVWDRYQWQVNNDAINPLNNKPTFTTTQVGTFNFKLTVWNDLGCATTLDKDVEVHDLPTFTLNDVTTCPNIPVTFTGLPSMSSYLWSDNSTNNSLTVNAVGDVSLSVIDINGCTFKETATVSWFAAPVVDIKYFSTVINADISPDEIFTCPENSVTLTATAGFSNYSWSHNASETTNVTSATVAIGGQTAVNLEVTDGNGCKTTDALVVKANAVPVFDMNSIPAEVCLGDVLTTPDVWDRYQWQVNNDAINPLNNKPTFTTTQVGTFNFKLTVWNDLGCATTLDKDVEVHDLPTFTLNDVTTCPNIPVTFTGLPSMSSYLWSDNSTNNSLTVNAVGDVSLSVIDINGCTFKETATVSWFAAPVVDIKYFSTVINADISPDEIFTCPENSVTLTATAGFSNYSWSHNASETTNVTSATVAIGGQTAVNLEVIDGNGCKATDALVVKANAVPVFDMSSIPAEVCLGDVLTTPDIWDRYQWQVNNDAINPLNNKPTFTTTQVGTFNFKLTVWNDLGCATTLDKDVEVHDLPTFTLNDVTTCPNIPVTFTGLPSMSSYLWSDNSTNNSLTVNAVGDVSLSVIDINGCTFKETATVSWFAAPVVDIKYFSTVINADISPDEIFTCPENSVTLTATAGFSNYSWSHNASETTNVTSATVAIGGQTAVNLEVTDGNGCKTTDALVVKANAVPVFDMSSIPAEVCLGDVLTTPDVWDRYQWQVNNDAINPLNNKSTFTTTQVGTFNFKLTVWNDLGCATTLDKDVEVHDLPTFTLNDVTTCPNIPVTFTGLPSMSSYLWSDNSTNNSLTVNAVGDVSLSVIDINGCTFKETATVSWFAAPVVDIKYFSTVINADISPDEIFTCPENSVTLTATAGFSNYSWSHNASETTNVTSATVAIGGQTAVNLEVTDGNGCKTTDALVVSANAVPVFDMSSIPAEVCLGDVLTTPDIWDRYQWQVNNDAIDPLNNKPTFTTTQVGTFNFKLTVWNTLGCATTLDKDVKVHDLPTFTLSDVTTCPNIPVTFTGLPSMSSYLWSDNSTNNSLTVNAVGDVSLSVIDVNGCTFKETATVSWFAAPVVDISYTSTVLGKVIQPDTIYTCPAPALGALLTATPGFNHYLWDVDINERNNSLQVAPPYNPLPAAPGELLVNLTVTDGNNCLATDQVRLIAYDTPGDMLNAIQDEICSEELISITPIKTQIFRHEWDFNGTVTTKDSYTPQQGGTLKLTVWNEFGCSVSEPITVYEPIIAFKNGIDKAIICHGAPYTFEVVPVVGYDYKWSDNSSNINYTATNPNTYWVEMKHSTLGCKTKAPVELEWHPGVLFNVANELVVCKSGLNYRIQGDVQMTDYEWRLDGSSTILSTDNFILTNPALEAGNVKFNVTANYNPVGSVLPNLYAPTVSCPIAQSFEFVVKDEPDPLKIDKTLSCAPAESRTYDGKVYNVEILCICDGQTIALEGFNDFIAYQWAIWNSGTSSFDIIAAETNRTLDVSSDGIYRLEATQPKEPAAPGSCVSYGVVEVRIKPNPIINIGVDKDVCISELFNITNIGADANDHSYVWKLNDDEIASGVGLKEVVNQTKPGVFTVLATGLNSCESTASITVTEPVAPEISLNNEVVCQGASLVLGNKWSNEIDLTAIPNYVTHRWYLKSDMTTELTGASLTQTPLAGDYIYTLQVDAKSNPLNALAPTCTYEADFKLIVRPIPVFTILSDDADLTVCDGEVITLRTNASYPLYNWIETADATTSLGNNYQLVVSKSGQYQLTAFNNYGCSSSQQETVTVHPLPNVDITVTGRTTICNGEESVRLELDNAAVYDDILWSFNASTTPDIVVTDPNTYKVTAKLTATQCSNSAEVKIDAHPKTTLVLIDSEKSICEGSSYLLALDATEAAKLSTYQWYKGSVAVGNEVGLASSDLTLANVKLADAGTYVLDAKDTNGCSVSTSFTLTVNLLPIVNLGLDQETCAGTPFTFDAGGTDIVLYQWTDLTAPIDLLPNGSTISVKEAGDYQVEVWDLKGCRNQDQVALSVNALPVFDLGPDVTVCKSSSYTVAITDATGLSNFIWNKPILGNGSSIITTGAATHSVSAQDAKGCVGEATVVVSEYEPTTLSLLSTKASICEGSDYQLPLDATEAAKLSTYQWYKGSIAVGNEIGGASSVVTLTNVTLANAGTYVLDAKDKNGCSVSTSFSLIVNPLPIVNLGLDQETCAGTPFTFDAGGTDIVLYQWTDLTAPIDLLPNGSTISVKEAGDYQVEVWDLKGCRNQDQVALSVNALPVFDLGPDVTVCKSSSYTVAITDATGLSNFIWNKPILGNGSSIITTGSATHSVSAQDAKGCVGEATVVVSEYEPTTLSLLSTKASICEGSDYQLPLDATEAAKLSTYLWYKGSVAVGNEIGGASSVVTLTNVTLANAGTYVLDAKDKNGCSVSTTFELTVNPLPIVNLGLDQETCASTPFTFDAGGTDIVLYQWTDLTAPIDLLPNGSTISVKEAGDYQVEVWDLKGCRNQDQVALSVNALPVFDLGPDVTVCKSSSYTVAITDATGLSNFIWNKPILGNGSSIITTGSATHSVSAQDAKGCVGEAKVAVSEYMPTTLSLLSTKASICAGSDYQLPLDATEAAKLSTYQWYKGSIAVGNEIGGASSVVTLTNVTLANAGTYVLDAKDKNGCSVSTSFSLIVNPLPIVNLGLDQETCAGTPFTFDAGGTDIVLYQWTDLTAPIDLLPNGSTISVKEAGDYQVEVWDLKGCRNQDQVALSVNALPVFDLGPDVTVCKSSSYTVAITDATGLSNFIWNKPILGNGSSIITTGSATHSVSAQDAKGCVGEATVVVSEYMPTTISLLSTKASICAGSDYQLPLDATEAAKLSTYQWYKGSVAVGNEIGGASSVVTLTNVTLANAGTYVLDAKDKNGCSVSTTFELTVNPLPIVNLGLDQETCAGTPFTFDAGGTDIVLYQWTDLTAPIDLLPNGSTISVKEAGDYQVEVWDLKGCRNQDQVALSVNALPVFDLGPDVTVCKSSSYTVAITDATGLSNFIWNKPILGNGSSIITTGSATHSVSAQDAKGCVGEATVVVSEYMPTTISLLSTKASICAGSDYQLPLDATEAAKLSTYQWYKGSVAVGNEIGGASSVVTLTNVTLANAGTYVLDAKDKNGCSVSTTFELTVNPLPIVNLGLDQETCASTPFTFDAGGTDIVLYQWTDLTAPIDLLPNGSTISVKEAGDYQVEVWDLKGCRNQDQVALSVNALPVFDLGPDVTVCKSSSYTVAITDATGLSNFIWNKPILGNGSSIITTGAATHSVSAQDAKGCVGEATVVVSEYEPTTLSLLSTKASICEGSDYQLPLDATEAAKLSTYQWYKGSIAVGNEIGGASSVVTLTNVTLANAGTYVLDGKDLNGCSVNGTFELTVNPLPDFTVGNDRVICKNDTAIIGTLSSFQFYTWTNASNPAQVIPNNKRVAVDEDGDYTLSVRDIYNCSASKSVNVKVNDLPDVNIGNDFSVCYGESYQLAVTNPTTLKDFSWSSGQTGVDSISNLKGSSSYVLIAKDIVTSCVNSDTAMVNELPLITIEVARSVDSLCVGSNYMLSLPAKESAKLSSYQWYQGSVSPANAIGTPNSDVVVTTAGVYWVEGADTSVLGCRVSASMVLNYSTMPQFALGSAKQTCDGIAVELKPDKQFPLYQWRELSNPSTVISNEGSLSVNSTGNYGLKVWLMNGCSIEETVSVVVHPNPTISIDTDINGVVKICEGSSFNLTTQSPNALTSYLWNNGATTSSITSSIIGEYIVSAWDGNGCLAKDTATVGNFKPTVLKMPSFPAICDNAPTLLESPLTVPAEANSYQWYKDVKGGGITGGLNQPWWVNIEGTYVLHVVDLNGCEAIASMILTTKAAPVIDLGNDRMKCMGDTVMVNANTSYLSYTWNGVELGQQNSFMLSNLGSNVVTLDVEGRNGCFASDVVTIDVKPLPTISVGSDILVCPGVYSTLTAQTNAPLVVWSTGDTATTITVNMGEFWANAIDANGCVAKASVMVNWRAAPEPNLGPNDLICPLDEVTIDAGVFDSYLWHNGELDRYKVADEADTVNTVIVTDQYGCKGWAGKMVYHMDLPEYSFGSDTIICGNDKLLLDAGPGYLTYLWEDGSINQSRTVDSSGVFSVYVSDGCTYGRDTITLGHLPTPIINQLDTMYYAQIIVDVSEGIAPYEFSLNGGDFQTSNKFRNLENGIYEVYVKDAKGCWDRDTIEFNSILDITIPNVFTPNGDGYNDIWRIEGIERFPEAEIMIYDRYGKLLIKFNGTADGWNGLSNGVKQPSDDYWFVVYLKHINKTLKGNLTLKW